MTPRDLRRAGLAPDPLGVVLVLLSVALLAACSPQNPVARVFLRDEHRPGNGTAYADGAPHVAIVTSSGVTVDYPVWLDYPNNAEHLAAMFAEVAETPPDADPRIDPRLRGVPPGLTVVVLSGKFYTPASPTGLANGLYVSPSTIYVAWRSDSRGLRLPALGHELRHFYTGDSAGD